MKNAWILGLGILVASASYGFAHDEMEGKGMEGMKGMHCDMMSSGMVATSDGGVVVRDGNMLTKYDKNLKVVKEVELASKGKCMTCKGMHKHKASIKGDETKTSEPAAAVKK